MRHHFYLVSPGVTAPDTVGAMLMTVAGISWGFTRYWAEEVTPRLLVASFAMLGGVWLVLAQRAKSARSPHDVFGDV